MPVRNSQKPWYMASVQETAAALGVQRKSGLTKEQVAERIKGTKPPKKPNKIKSPGFSLLHWSILVILASSALALFLLTTNAWILLFVGAAMLVGMFSGAQQNYVHYIVTLANQKTQSPITVLRESKQWHVDPKNIVLGDILLLNEGDHVPANIRLITVDNLVVDETFINGTIAATKNTHTISEQKRTTQPKNMLFFGSYIRSGSASGIVVELAPISEHAATTISKHRLNKKQRQKNYAVSAVVICLGLLTTLVGVEPVVALGLAILLGITVLQYLAFWLRYTAWATLYERLLRIGFQAESFKSMQRLLTIDTIIFRSNENSVEQAAFIHLLQAEYRIEVRADVSKKQVKEIEQELNIADSSLSCSKFLSLRRNEKQKALIEYQLLLSFSDLGLTEAVSVLEQAGRKVLVIDESAVANTFSKAATAYITLSASPKATAMQITNGVCKQPSLKKISSVFDEIIGFKKRTAY